jgi:hypothetical protein
MNRGLRCCALGLGFVVGSVVTAGSKDEKADAILHRGTADALVRDFQMGVADAKKKYNTTPPGLKGGAELALKTSPDLKTNFKIVLTKVNNLLMGRWSERGDLRKCKAR